MGPRWDPSEVREVLMRFISDPDGVSVRAKWNQDGGLNLDGLCWIWIGSNCCRLDLSDLDLIKM